MGTRSPDEPWNDEPRLVETGSGDERERPTPAVSLASGMPVCYLINFRPSHRRVWPLGVLEA